MYPMMPISTEHSYFLYILLRLLKKTLITLLQLFLLIRYFNSRFSKVWSCLLSRARLSNRRKGRIINKGFIITEFYLAICSTVISGDIVALLARQNIKVVSLIHELPHLIQQYSAEGKAKNIAEFAYKVVFPSQYVYEKFRTITELDPPKMSHSPSRFV